jgi:hypothetical protein
MLCISIKSEISLLFDNTLVAPFNTSSSAPSTSIFIHLTCSIYISFSANKLSKVLAFISINFSVGALPGIIELYIVWPEDSFSGIDSLTFDLLELAA